MSMAVVTGASCMCTFGTTPGNLTATSAVTTIVSGQVAGTIDDGGAGINISPFGMCTTLTNPQVAAATAAAMGVLTPQPCLPQTAKWIPGQVKVLVGGKPMLTQDCSCTCAYGGTIKILSPGQVKVIVG